MFPSSLTFSDLYGGRRGTQQATTEKDAARASGEYSQGTDSSPAYFWVAFVGVLIVVRFLAERRGGLP